MSQWEAPMPQCAICREKATTSCLWCEGRICAQHCRPIYVGNETGIEQFSICPTCQILWEHFRSQPPDEKEPG
jgi:hypothetical protein